MGIGHKRPKKLQYWTISRFCHYLYQKVSKKLEKHSQFTNPLHWDLGNRKTVVDFFLDEIVLLENPSYQSVVSHPVKLDVVVTILCLKGTLEGKLNLKPFMAEAPCLFIVLADQILQCDHFSDDFSGLSIVMSKSFLNEAFNDAQVTTPLFRAVHDYPFITLNGEDTESMAGYFHLLQKSIRRKENPNLRETLKYLTLAFFYENGNRFHKISDESKKPGQNVLVDKFLSLVEANFREQRMVEFYAEKLFLTPKHLSKTIKSKSGKTAGQWIEDYVMLEAMALLKSTDMTIQQISDELNFPTQSFFGKYFKCRAGMSPKNYRKVQ